jgi:uncharacterized membrane protein
MQRLFALALTFVSLLWVAALVATPFQFSAGSVFAGLFYEACGLICHQLPERSFHLNGVQMPVCARCVGLYASGAVGALFAWTTREADSSARRARRLLFWAAIPTAATLFIEWVLLAQTGSATRALAAIPLGAAIGWLLVRTLHAEAVTAVAVRQMRYHA